MPDLSSSPPGMLWTIGHSNHSLDVFLDLLARPGIEVVADVRTSPYARYAVQFNREAIQPALQERGIRYLFLGDLLGGRVEGAAFHDADGRVLYDRVAESPGFRRGIERLLDGIRRYRVAVLCGEEDPTECHRRLLIGRVMRERGARLLHIRGDGRVQTEEELAAEETFRKTKGQKNLFETEETGEWKSARSALPKKTRPSSSEFCERPESGD